MWNWSKGRTTIFITMVLAVIIVFPALVSAQRAGSTLVATPLAPTSVYDLAVKKHDPGLKGALGGQQQGLTSVIVKLKGEPLSRYRGGYPD